MRPTATAAFLVAALCLAGCTSSSGIDGLTPSSETTSSIPRPNQGVPGAQAMASAIETAAEDAPDARAAIVEDEIVSVAETRASPQAQLSEEALSVAALIQPERPEKASRAISKLTVTRHRFRDAKPINFGKVTPKSYAVHGVDVSRWQGEIDWVKLRSQGANFAYIKATDGGDHLDPMFRKNWRGAHAAGLKRGAYHFFYWCRVASEQADWFIRNVPKVEGALPPVIDVEYNGESKCKRRLSRATVLEKMTVFMDRLEAHYGQRPVIYTAPDFYRDNLKGAFPNHPFWLRAVAQHPSKVYPGRKWVFWQYSGSGLSHGVKGKIDLNVFHGNAAEWRRWASGQSLTASAD